MTKQITKKLKQNGKKAAQTGFDRGIFRELNEEGRREFEAGERFPDVLANNFFHSLNSQGKVEWQGMVVGRVEPGIYLVQLFEWMMGEPNVERLVTIAEMKGWFFYADNEAMVYSYDYGICREGGKYRDRVPKE